jgi:thiol-disulfide isomerase/thioredoxin
MPTANAPSSMPEPLLVACLCAGWCHLCDSYRETFAALREQFPGWRFVWIDIEDEAELVGELDIETFPTLLIGVGERLRFVGPVNPQAATARRLLTAAAESSSGGAPAATADPAARALLVRLQRRGC